MEDSKSLFGVEIRPGLTIKLFLEHWHMKLSSKDEEIEFIIARLQKVINTQEGFFLLRQILALQARAVKSLTFRFGKSYYADELALIIKHWKNFQDFFGEKETAYLLNQNPGDLEKMLDGWRVILTRKAKKK